MFSRSSYRVSSRCRPKGCLAQGVSVSGSESGPRSWLVAADARAHTCGCTNTQEVESTIYIYDVYISAIYSMMDTYQLHTA